MQARFVIALHSCFWIMGRPSSSTRRLWDSALIALKDQRTVLGPTYVLVNDWSPLSWSSPGTAVGWRPYDNSGKRHAHIAFALERFDAVPCTPRGDGLHCQRTQRWAFTLSQILMAAGLRFCQRSNHDRLRLTCKTDYLACRGWRAHWLPVLSNAAALLWDAMDDINWVGFYLVDHATVAGVDLDSSRVQSRTPEPASPGFVWDLSGKGCLCAHSFWKGVCGTAATTKNKSAGRGRAQFPGHIACDCIEL